MRSDWRRLGKTICFTYIVKSHLEKGGRALIFTHRTELLKQAGSSFDKFGLNPEFITAGSKPDLSLPLHVTMVETFNRREYSHFIETRTLIVIDEAHLNIFNKMFPLFPKSCLVIGVTATPYRKGKSIPALDTFYNDLIQEIDTPELIEMGYLSKAKTYGVTLDLSDAKKKGEDYDVSEIYEQNKLYQGVVKNWKRICEGSKTLLFASNVSNSLRVCKEFNDNGYEAKHIDGNTTQHERDSVLKWFSEPGQKIVCNCGILNAGFDQPDIETVILYRATTSLPLFLQMCGRGSRKSKGKDHFNILDFGNNVHRLGFWEDPRVWSLRNDTKKTQKQDVSPIKECPDCGALVRVSIKKCNYCDHEFKKTEKEEIAELQLLPKREKFDLAKRSNLKEKARLAKMKIVSPFWILHQMTNISEAREFCRLMDYKPGFEYANKDRFKVFKNG